MKKLAILLLFLASAARAATFNSGNPSTTNNDDSCDIAVMPAATLLLPYFEVDFNAPQTVARTTLFTVVNTTQIPQIARVTLWTDWGYPVLEFNIFLTGYDVQAINLYDILGSRGIIAPPAGTSNRTEPGARSLPNDDNSKFNPGAAERCASLPGAIPALLLQDIRNGLTKGTYSFCGTAKIGGVHQNAVGYATIDVVSNCTASLPTDPTYFTEILFDNVLTGDYEWIDPNPATGNYAGGNPLVHLRAIPEGGNAGSRVESNLPYTFYDRLTANAPGIDRRQPLPSAFAARFIQGGAGAFNTNLRIWREGVTGGTSQCTDYAANNGSAMRVTEVVRFDEHENPSEIVPCNLIILCPTPPPTVLPLASSLPTSASILPPLTTGDVGGWLYLNLANAGSANYHTPANRHFDRSGILVRQNQNWVVTSMTAEGRFQVAYDALMLANGCSLAPTKSSTTSPIGPGPNVDP